MRSIRSRLQAAHRESIAEKPDFLLYPLAEGFLLQPQKDACIICINDNVKDAAEEIVRGICDESGYNVRFILKRSSNNYL